MVKRIADKSATFGHGGGNSVGIRQFRDHLSSYLDRVKAGESLTITEHGKPIARIIGQTRTPWIAEMVVRGELTPARRPMPDLSRITRVKIAGSTQDLIDEIR